MSKKRYQVTAIFSVWVEDDKNSYENALEKASEHTDQLPGCYTEVEEWERLEKTLDRMFKEVK